ncbi:MAG TPA: DMT family transporter [Nitrospinota bacterium]|nr:DMT family transporter [Nitrospinota bacterium]
MTPVFAILAALSAAFFFAVADIFLKRSLQFTSPTMAPLITAPVQWILFTVFCLYAGAFAEINTSALPWFMAAGFMNSVSFLFLFLLAIQRVGVARAAPLKGCSPIFTAIFAFVILGERLAAFQYLGIALAVAGLFVITSEGWGRDPRPAGVPAPDRVSGDGTPPAAGAGSAKVGFYISILAGAAVGIGAVLVKIGLAITPSPLLGAWIGSSVAVLFFPFLALCFPMGERRRIPRAARRWLIPAGAAAAIYSLILAIPLGEVSIVTTLYQTSPLMVLVLTVIFLRRLERVTPRVVPGALLTVGGGSMVILG